MVQPSSRARLQRLLNALNRPVREELREGRDVLGRLVVGEPIRFSPHALIVKRVGDHLEVHDEKPDDQTRFLLELVNLILDVGVDRLRQCHFVDPETRQACARWFIAKRGQRWCSPEHSRQGSYRTWWKLQRAEQREETIMKMHPHKDWKIGTKTFEIDGDWSTRLEIYEPGTGPRTHSPVLLPFHRRLASPAEAESAAVAHAKEWIDRQLPRKKVSR